MTLSGLWNRARRVEPRFDVGLAAVVVVSAVWTGALGTLVAVAAAWWPARKASLLAP